MPWLNRETPHPAQQAATCRSPAAHAPV